MPATSTVPTERAARRRTARRARPTSGGVVLVVATLALAMTGVVPARPAAAAPHVPIAGDVELDRQVAHTLESLVAGDVGQATVLARSLARRHPRFALGQLLHAELSAAAALDGTLVGSDRPWSPELVDLLLEARARLEASPARAVVGAGSSAFPNPTLPREPGARAPDPRASVPSGAAPVLPVPSVPAPFVQIGRGVEHLVIVDLERSTLALHAVREGVATPVREHYVSSGSAGFGKRREGDRKTPLGLYRIVDTHEDRALPELYGAGALVLDYPNAHDRHLGRTGSGIWLHGVPRERRSRAPRSSEGCVTMSNEHLLALDARLDPARTLVLLGSSPSGHAVSRPGRSGAETGTRAATAADGGERALGRYRALFRHWRDAHVREGSAPATIADLDENDVTILETTVDGLPGVPDLLVMDVSPATDGAAGITLWWTRTGGAGDWLLTLEEGVRGGT